jgi:hypothetical protein
MVASGLSKAITVISLAVVGVMGVGASSAVAATPGVAWQIRSLAIPTTVSPATGGTLHVFISDIGGQAAEATEESPVTITDTLPTGVTPTEASGKEPTITGNTMNCSIAGQTVTCTYGFVLPELNQQTLVIDIKVSVVPGTSGTLSNQATVSGGVSECGTPGHPSCPTASTSDPIAISSQAPPFGIADFSTYDANAAGASETQAGAHPNALVTAFDVNSIANPNPRSLNQFISPEDVKDFIVDLPVGLVGNPQATPKCPQNLIGPPGGSAFSCPAVNVILGTVGLNQNGTYLFSDFQEPNGSEPTPIVNVQPEAGFPAQFAFALAGHVVMMYSTVVPTSSGYALRVTVPGIPRIPNSTEGTQLTFLGNPGAHDVGGTPAAFFTNPVDCSQPKFTTTLHIDSWVHPGRMNPDGTPDFTDPNWKTRTADSPPVAGCEKLQFNPTIRLQPDTTQADAPTGPAVDIGLPQNADPNGLATPPLKDATVTLPQGMAVSPSSADGLQGCSDAQIALSSAGPGACPLASQIATVKVHTPVLVDPLEGQVFLGTPECSPCTEAKGDPQSGRMIRLFLQVQGSGVVIKLPGTVSADPATGQLTARFKNNPQQPFDDLKLQFKQGPRAPLVNPSACGTYTSTSDLVPWSSPFTPDATPSSSFEITRCGSPNQFAPSFTAGTVNPQAGAFSPFTLSFSRQDTDQQFSGLSASLPPGLLAKLAGVPLCPDANANAGSCPASSQVGSVTTGAGPGSHPFFLPGQIYLTGPYNGGPYGLSVEVPAVAGPFNLGTVVVRQSLRVDPHTAQASVISDPFPRILDGIPLQIRTVSVTIDRPAFTFNPTSCDPLQITGTLTSLGGLNAPVSSRFQAANCANLPFKPSFAVSTQGKTSKVNGASLVVKVAQNPGEANIHKVNVTLPIALPSRLTTLQKACTASQFESNPAGCPEGSFVGTATAHTPVLAVPLTGPAILVSHGGAAFPDLVLVLQGEGIRIDLVGNTDIKKGFTFSRFETVPDAPISSFELNLPEGPHSVLAANGSLCTPTKTVTVRKRVAVRRHGRTVHVLRRVKQLIAAPLLMPTTIVGQNGAQITQSTKITVTGCSKAQQTTKHKKRKKGKKKK